MSCIRRLELLFFCSLAVLACINCTEVLLEHELYIHPNQHHAAEHEEQQQGAILLLPQISSTSHELLTALSSPEHLGDELSRRLGSASPSTIAAERNSHQQEHLQDKWLSERLSESVNWTRLTVDTAALSRVLAGAKEAAKDGWRANETAGIHNDEEFLVELLRHSEMLADNLDQLLGLLHRLQREAAAEGVGFGLNGWNLVVNTEEALGAAGAFAETLDDAASANRSVATRSTELLPAMALRLSNALNNFGADPTGGRLAEAIGKQQLVPLLQDPLLRQLPTLTTGRKTNTRMVA